MFEIFQVSIYTLTITILNFSTKQYLKELRNEDSSLNRGRRLLESRNQTGFSNADPNDTTRSSMRTFQNVSEKQDQQAHEVQPPPVRVLIN